MNINTLNAVQIEHKSNEVPFALYKNNLGNTPSYSARVISQGTCTVDDLACDIISSGIAGDFSKEKLLEAAALFRSAKIARILTGCTVDDGITRCWLSLSGTFNTQNDSYSTERHSLSLTSTVSSKVKDILQKVTPVIRRGNSIVPVITEVFDLETKGSEVLTRNGFLEIKGTNIAVQGQNEEVGLYFVNTEDESKNVKLGAEKLGRNTSGSLCCVVPSELEEGTYRLMIRTQSLSGKVLSKEIKECVSEQTFRIG